MCEEVSVGVWGLMMEAAPVGTVERGMLWITEAMMTFEKCVCVCVCVLWLQIG